jgi:hypothetical protein
MTYFKKYHDKDLFDNPFVSFKEWETDEDRAYDDLGSVGKIGYNSESFSEDNEDYSKW